ncbi:hypothetical protein [Methylobacterium trifolii]|uniref:Uncharacterized protein n=1 Tax=Methylobacterium trifolii TaxID=1003092 RepID=A0ABQ4TV98_9HYPH|nr:hypothetical protein [Methylobacterium trifolii]GJE59206.1 hypothetical protein MPOCJGCO_1294 [Methylobacterium trifolii]
MPRPSRYVRPALLAGLLLACVPVQAASCRQSIGPARAAELVRQCIEVSPATRPPCNDANPCELIRGEIARGCGMLDAGSAPDFCGTERPED